MSNIIYFDAKYLGIKMRREEYGLFSRYFPANGKAKYDRQSQSIKRTQSIVPDLVSCNHPDGSCLKVPGNQMWEIKRVNAVCKFNANTGNCDGMNGYYKSSDDVFVRASDQRQNEVPREYIAKARKSDAEYGDPGSSVVLNALRAVPEVKGLAIGAFGELSSNFELLMKGLAYEGALKATRRFGWSKDENQQRANIKQWLQRRWSRLALITAVEVRYNALRYVGGSAQSRAAHIHGQYQGGEDWRYEEAARQREQDTADWFTNPPNRGGFCAA
jgi:hypothetical protein